MEASTLNKNVTNGLEAFEMWTYGKLFGISWIDEISNIEFTGTMEINKFY